MWTLIVLISGAFAQQADCNEATTTADLLGAMEVAEDAWSLADAAGFTSSNTAIATILPCLNEPITRATAARIHRMNGMSLFLSREPETMGQAFAAARWVQPNYQWSSDLAPAGHPVRDAYVVLAAEDPQNQPTRAPKDGTSWYDGREDLQRPTAWPTLHQLYDEDGGVQGTWLLWPDDPLPDYPRSAATTGSTSNGADKRGARLPMLLGAAGGFAASGVMYGLAASSSAAYRSTDGTQDADGLDKLRSATNTRYWTSVGLVGASTATTIGAFAVARW